MILNLVRLSIAITLLATTSLWALAQTMGTPIGGMGTGYVKFNARTGNFAASGKAPPAASDGVSEFSNKQSSSSGFLFFREWSGSKQGHFNHRRRQMSGIYSSIRRHRRRDLCPYRLRSVYSGFERAQRPIGGFHRWLFLKSPRQTGTLRPLMWARRWNFPTRALRERTCSAAQIPAPMTRE